MELFNTETTANTGSTPRGPDPDTDIETEIKTEIKTEAESPMGTVDARVRVVEPVGGRGGWRGVDSAAKPAATSGGFATAPGGGGDVDERVWLREYLHARLHREDRVVLILFHFEGLSAREIAAVLDDTEASTAARLDHLNHSLKKAWCAFQDEQSSLW